MLPAAVVSALVKVDGMETATRQLQAFSSNVTDSSVATEHMNTVNEKVKPSALKASEGIRTLDKTAKSAHTSIKDMVTGLLVAGGAFAGFEAAKNAIDSTLELGNSTQRLSAATRMDIKTSSEWIEIMKVRGQSATATGRQFVTLSRNVQEAEAGSKAASEAFKTLGISQKTLHDTDPSQLIKLVADRFQALGPSQQRAAIAQKLFGVGTQALLPILASGSKGVDELLASASRYGAFLPNNTKQLKQAVTAQDNLNLALDGLKITFTQAVLPTLVSGADKFMKFIQQMRTGRGEGGKFGKEVSGAFHTVKNVVTSVVNAVGGIKPALEIAAGAFLSTKIISFARSFSGAITGGVNSLKSLPGKLKTVASLLGFGGKATSMVGRLESPVIPEMNVATMIVKNMISPGSGGPLKTIERDVEDVTKTGGDLTLAQKFKAFFRGGGEDSAAGKFASLAGKSPVAASSFLASLLFGFTSMKSVQGTSPSNRVNAFLHGIDPTNLLHLAHLPSVSDLLLPTVSKPLSNVPSPFGTGTRSTAGALGGLPTHATITQVTHDFLAMNNALGRLEGHQVGIRKTAAALGRLAQRASDLGDFKYAIADKLGQELIKTQNVAGKGVTGIIGRLKELPPQARAQAALAMIEMSRTLEREGAVPKGTTARLSKEIAAPLKTIGIHAKTSAGLVKQLSTAINRLPKSKTIDFYLNYKVTGRPGSLIARLLEAGKKGEPAVPLHDIQKQFGGTAPNHPIHIVHQHHHDVAPKIPPISVSPSVQHALDAAGTSIGKTLSDTGRKLTQTEGALTKLSNQRISLEGKRNSLENQLIFARNKAQKAAIAHELQINAAQLRGVSHETSILTLRKSGLSAQLSTEKSAASASAKALAAQQKAQKSAAEAAKKAREAEQKHIAWIVAVFGHIPSQSGLQQIRMQEIQNRLTTATTAGNIGGQRKALDAEKRLDREWLELDKKKLRKINAQLNKRISKQERRGLIQDKLGLIQEIGSIESDLGNVASSLASLDSSSTTDTSGFDLAPTGSSVVNPTAYDVRSQIPGPRGGVHNHHHHHHHGNINIKVEKDGDEKKVYDALDRVTGGSLHARVRRAGLRGT